MDPERFILLLLPGLDGTDIFFGPLLEELRDRVPPSCEVRVWPLPSRGAQDYATLLEALRRELADVTACCLLGWSFSGPLALMLAAAEPHRVRGVILAASFLRAPQPKLRYMVWAVRGPVVWCWRVLRRVPLWLLRPRRDALRQAKDRTWREVRPGLLAERLREVARVDARAELQALRARDLPLMYIASAQDGVVPRSALEQILAEYPGLWVETIPGTHQSLYNHAREAVGPIAGFSANLVDKDRRMT